MEESKRTKLKNRGELLLGGVTMVAVGVFFISNFEGWWKYLVGGFFIWIGWVNLKRGLFGTKGGFLDSLWKREGISKVIRKMEQLFILCFTIFSFTIALLFYSFSNGYSVTIENVFFWLWGLFFLGIGIGGCFSLWNDVKQWQWRRQPNVVALQNILKEPEAKPTARGKTYNIGDRIDKRYEIYKIFGGKGKSGMGVVYVCYDHKFKEVHALKTFQDKYLFSKEMKDNFKKEALAWIQIEKHPYIVRANWVQELDYRMFVSCEFIAPNEQGRNTLTHYLKSHVSLEQALIWSIQFCYGMEHAYSKGVSPHRDIKPDNIMITSEGTLKITDFGLARLWDNAGIIGNMADMNEEREGLTFIKTKKGRFICGTPPWMAPEQFDGIADVRSDIYSFGIVMYQMVQGGKLPFYPKKGDDWETAHKSYAVFPQQGEAISDLFLIIERCLRKRPKDRYRDFQELRERLTKLYKDTAGKEPPPPPDKIQLEAWELNNKGFSLANLGLLDEAVKAYKDAIRINPEDPDAHNNFGITLANKSHFDEAIKELKEAIRINPEHAIAHYNIGLVFHYKGQIDEAINAYKDAIRFNPEYADTYNNLGNALDKKGLFDEAIKAYKDAIRINPEDAVSYRSLGYALDKKGHFDEAIKAYREALMINPRDADAYYFLGNAFYKKGLLDEAIKAYKMAIRINPEDAATYRRLGYALKDKYQIEEAINAFESFLRLAPPEFAEQVENVRKLITTLKGEI